MTFKRTLIDKEIEFLKNNPGITYPFEMTKLEEFVKNQYQGMAENFPWKFQNHDWEEENHKANFWLRAFVKLVRERAASDWKNRPRPTGFGHCEIFFVAFNEIVKEFELEAL